MRWLNDGFPRTFISFLESTRSVFCDALVIVNLGAMVRYTQHHPQSSPFGDIKSSLGTLFYVNIYFRMYPKISGYWRRFL
jgi:hypothetical protein